jgi:hypothetical protein
VPITHHLSLIIIQSGREEDAAIDILQSSSLSKSLIAYEKKILNRPVSFPHV